MTGIWVLLALQEDLSAWMKEGMKKKKEREDVKVAGVLQMSIEELFHVEPSRRGQRRANLFKQRMNEAAEEEAIRKGKGSQAFWEAARVGNMDEIMNKLFRCASGHDQHELKNGHIHNMHAYIHIYIHTYIHTDVRTSG